MNFALAQDFSPVDIMREQKRNLNYIGFLRTRPPKIILLYFYIKQSFIDFSKIKENMAYHLALICNVAFFLPDARGIFYRNYIRRSVWGKSANKLLHIISLSAC